MILEIAQYIHFLDNNFREVDEESRTHILELKNREMKFKKITVFPLLSPMGGLFSIDLEQMGYLREGLLEGKNLFFNHLREGGGIIFQPHSPKM